jgi:hypothetical protein
LYTLLRDKEEPSTDSEAEVPSTSTGYISYCIISYCLLKIQKKIPPLILSFTQSRIQFLQLNSIL